MRARAGGLTGELKVVVNVVHGEVELRLVLHIGDADAGIGARHLQQFFRQSAEVGERSLNLSSPCLDGSFRQFANKPLCLRERTGDGRVDRQPEERARR